MFTGELLYGPRFEDDALLRISRAAGVFPLERRIRAGLGYAALVSNLPPEVSLDFIHWVQRNDPNSPNAIIWEAIQQLNQGKDITPLIERLEKYSEGWKQVDDMRKLNEMRRGR